MALESGSFRRKKRRLSLALACASVPRPQRRAARGLNLPSLGVARGASLSDRLAFISAALGRDQSRRPPPRPPPSLAFFKCHPHTSRNQLGRRLMRPICRHGRRRPARRKVNLWTVTFSVEVMAAGAGPRVALRRRRPLIVRASLQSRDWLMSANGTQPILMSCEVPIFGRGKKHLEFFSSCLAICGISVLQTFFKIIFNPMLIRVSINCERIFFNSPSMSHIFFSDSYNEPQLFKDFPNLHFCCCFFFQNCIFDSFFLITMIIH